MTNRKLRFETLQIHGGYKVDDTLSRGLAIHPTSAFHFKSCDHAAKLFELSEEGYIYTRMHNPTTSRYEERVAALYGGVGALALSSGMSALLVTITSLARAGQNIVTAPYVYGGTHNQFSVTLRNMGIDCRFAANASVEALESLIDDNTRAVFVESMSNPGCVVADLEPLAAMAHRHGLPLVVDNTFGACGFMCNPFVWGADIVVDSATKWINGHGTAMGGVIVDGGSFDWGNGKFPAIDGPSEGYHGMNFYRTFGRAAFITKCRVDGLRDLGCSPSPFDAYLMLLGLETLSLRVAHQEASTRRLAEYFKAQAWVESVSYVGFEENPNYAAAQKYFRNGGACVLSVVLKGSLESTVRLVEALHLVAHMTMIGDSITVVTHPASTTHKQLDKAALRRADITPTLLRISPGLEHVEDIIADFEQAAKQI